MEIFKLKVYPKFIESLRNEEKNGCHKIQSDRIQSWEIFKSLTEVNEMFRMEKRSPKTINNSEQIKRQSIRSSSAILLLDRDFFSFGSHWSSRFYFPMLMWMLLMGIKIIGEWRVCNWLVGLKKGSAPFKLFENDHRLMLKSRSCICVWRCPTTARKVFSATKETTRDSSNNWFIQLRTVASFGHSARYYTSKQCFFGVQRWRHWKYLLHTIHELCELLRHSLLFYWFIDASLVIELKYPFASGLIAFCHQRFSLVIHQNCI